MMKEKPTGRRNWSVILAALSLLVACYGVWLHQTAIPETHHQLVSRMLEAQEKVQTEINHLNSLLLRLDQHARDPRVSAERRQALLQLATDVQREVALIANVTGAYDASLDAKSKRRLDHKEQKRLYNKQRAQE